MQKLMFALSVLLTFGATTAFATSHQQLPMFLSCTGVLTQDEQDEQTYSLNPDAGSSPWCVESIKAGISTSTVRAHQNKAFIRARNHLIDERQLERRADDGWCRL